MVNVYVREDNTESQTLFVPSNAAELLQLANSKFGKGGRLETDGGVVVGGDFQLVNDGTLIWRPPRGAPPAQEQQAEPAGTSRKRPREAEDDPQSVGWMARLDALAGDGGLSDEALSDARLLLRNNSNDRQLLTGNRMVDILTMQKLLKQVAYPAGEQRQPVFPDVYGSPQEGINHRRLTFMTKREQLCDGIFQLVGKRGYVLIKAPPQSGKTATLQLFGDYMAQKRVKCWYINAAIVKGSFDEAFAQKCGGSLAHLMAQVGKPTVVLVDEAAAIYNAAKSGSKFFWEELRVLAAGRTELASSGMWQGHQVRVVLAAAYGGKRSAIDSDQLLSTPTSTPINPEHPDMVITVLPSREKEGTTLQLSQEEFDELWGNFKRHSSMELNDVVKAYIWGISGHQAGLITVCLDYLLRELCNKLTATDNVSNNALYKLSADRFVDSLKNVRSLFYSKHLLQDASMASVVRALLWATQLPLDLFSVDKQLMKAVRLLNTTGHVIIDAEDRWVTFSSALHWTYSFRELYASHVKANVAPPTSMLQLLTLVLERISPDVLKQTMSLGTDKRLLESCWQFEVYRAAMSLLHMVISPDAGKAWGAKGFVDLYLPPPLSTALELTRDSDRLQEHIKRFDPPSSTSKGGKYYPMISCGAATQWAVVDFVSSGKQADQKHEWLYTVKFHDNWTAADIWHKGKCVASEVVLAGNTADAQNQALWVCLNNACAADPPIAMDE